MIRLLNPTSSRLCPTCGVQQGARRILGNPNVSTPRNSRVLFTRTSQLQRRCPRGAPTPQAALWSLPDDIVGAVQTGVSIGILISITLSALPILTGDSKERNERRYYQPDAGEGADNVKWSVMGVLSFLPFFNPMIWVFAALDEDADASALYWSFAFLYACPYLANGVQVDAFTLLTLAACVAHVQIERIAQTEPVEVELPDVLRAILRSFPGALQILARYGERIGEEVGDRTKRADEARQRKPDRKYLEAKSREARMELDEFDRRRRQRERQGQQNSSVDDY